MEASGANILSHYFPRFYGDYQGIKRDPSNRLVMEYLAHMTHRTLITLVFTADDISYVENRSPGRIVEALIEDFLALSGSGRLTVVIQNIGSATSDYSVR